MNIYRLARAIKNRLKYIGDKGRRLLVERNPRAVCPPQGFFESTQVWRDSLCVYLLLDPPHTILRHTPKTVAGVQDSIHIEFSSRLEYESPSTFVSVLPQGRLVGHAVITADNYLLADVSIEPGVTPDCAALHSVFKEYFLPTPHKIPGRAIALSSSGSESNYFHWMFDLLPRIDILRRSGFEVLPTDTFVVNSCSLPFQKETLQALGIDRIIESKRYPHLQADTLIVPSLPSVMGNIPAKTCQFLRSEFLPKEIRHIKKLNRIYISRKNSRGRKLLNENDIIEELLRRDFEMAMLEDMTFRQQVELFCAAEIVVAPHGAGLTNLVFCNPGTKIIELFSPQYINGCYWALSDVLDLDYYYLAGEGELSAKDDTKARVDFEIDLRKFRTLLSAVIDGA